MSNQFVRARGVSPIIGEDVFIADNARIISDVAVGDRSSICIML